MDFRRFFSGRANERMEDIVESTDRLLEYLQPFLDRHLPLYLLWFDGRAEPYASGAFLALYAAPERVAPVRHGPLPTTLTTNFKGDAVIGVDYERDEDHLRRLENVAPSLRRRGTDEIIYIAIHPEVEAIVVNHRNGGKARS